MSCELIYSSICLTMTKGLSAARDRQRWLSSPALRSPCSGRRRPLLRQQCVPQLELPSHDTHRVQASLNSCPLAWSGKHRAPGQGSAPWELARAVSRTKQSQASSEQQAFRSGRTEGGLRAEAAVAIDRRAGQIGLRLGACGNSPEVITGCRGPHCAACRGTGCAERAVCCGFFLRDGELYHH